MAKWTPEGQIDPEYARKVSEAFGGKPGRSLWDIIKEGWGDVIAGAGGAINDIRPMPAEGEGENLPENIAEGLEDYRGRRDESGGENTWGAEVPSDPGAAGPGIRPTQQATPEVSTEEPIVAEVDWILSGGQNDRYSRLRSAIGAKNDREMAGKLSEAYSAVTGERPNWDSGYDAAMMLDDPEILEAVLGSL